MRIKMLFLIITAIMFSLVSCEDKKTEFITQRIQYDVLIKSPDADMDWWVQNIEGLTRETLIKDLIEAALQGKVQTFDPFSLSLNTAEQVKNIGARYETVRMQRSAEPYEYYDTLILKSLSIHDITKIRFLEEWTLNRKEMKIDKNILGIAPVAENYDESGILRGYMPLFWIFYNDDYPKKLKGTIE